MSIIKVDIKTFDMQHTEVLLHLRDLYNSNILISQIKTGKEL